MTTVQDTVHSQGRSTYDVHIEIDIDCEELVDACGLEYTVSDQDETQNVITLVLDKDEFEEVFDTTPMSKANEQYISGQLLNYELAEYTTKVTVYKPSGDIISFY